MTADLLTSKLFIPPLRPSLVPRPRLVQQLNEGLWTNRKLTLVSAPAGFGKTTLIVDWLKQTNVPAAWLSLDEADNDLPRFLAYLAAALQHVDEEIGAVLQSALQSPRFPEIEKVLAGVLNEIATRQEPIILVLDDYHLLTEASVLKIISFVLDHQPPLLHIVLTTREDPELPLARLRAHDQLTELRARDLRFNREESDIFLRSVMGLDVSEQDVAALEGRTEGWAAGLQLAGLSMQKQSDLKSFIAEFSGTHRHILDYLTGEVLQQQPEDARTFLLQTAILDRLSGPLCDAVTGRHDSEEVLRHLDNANLFVIPLDEERRWYRYHHLFSDLLRSQVTRSHPEWVPGLHRSASLWYEENGDIQASVEHALQDTDLAQAARLVEQHAIPRLYQGEVTIVVGWFDHLPANMVETSPMLCIGKAWALALSQDKTRREEIYRSIQQAELLLDQNAAGEDLRRLVTGHAASLRAFTHQIPELSSDYATEVIALFQEAQRLLPEGEKAIRSVNALNIGYAYQALADVKAAGQAFTQTLEDGLAGGNFYAAVYGPDNLVANAILAGQMREALDICCTNIKRFNQALAGQNFPRLGTLYIMKGLVLLEMNRVDEAAQAMAEGLELIRWTGDNEYQTRGYAAMARLRLGQEDRPAMLEAVKNLEETWREGEILGQMLRHRLSLHAWPGNPQVQQNALDWLSRSGIRFGELQVLTGVKPKDQVRFDIYLGSAHVLASLASLKPVSQELEEALVYLERQAEFSNDHGIVSWFVKANIASSLLYHAVGKKEAALKTLEAALSAAAPTGLFRVFVDEGDPLQKLVTELRPRLKDSTLTEYASRLLEAFTPEVAKPENGDRRQTLLSERELEVLQNLSRGLSYEETGQQLFLSLNTVQFHVKNIYRKLLVNKRVQAIEKARELKLI